jgi:hypothetical protein
MKKKVVSFLLGILFIQTMFGQNLIPNGSFENGTYVNYVFDYNYFANYVPFWDKQCEMGNTGQYGTPDLFSVNYVSTSCPNFYKIPSNKWTNNLPLNSAGTRYAGFASRESLTSVITNASGSPEALAAGCYSLNLVAAKSQGITDCYGTITLPNTTTPKIEAVLRKSGTNMCSSGIVIFTSQSLTTGNWENLAGTFTITPAQAGIYDRIEFRILNPTSTYVFVDDFVLKSNKPSVSVNNVTVCSGQSTIITATGSPTGGTYLWSNGSTAPSLTVTPSTSISYSVVYTLNGCPSNSVSGNITVKPKPTVSVSNASVCNGTAATISAVGMASGGTYLWSNGSTASSVTVTSSTSVSYSVVYTLNGCSSNSVSGNITVKPKPTVSVSNATVCNGTAATISAVGMASGGTYLWSNGATTSSIIVTPSTTTTYSVIYSLNGCSSLTEFGTVTVISKPTVTVNSAAVCNGVSATLTATPSGTGGNYSWSNGATAASIIVTPTSTATYSVIYTLHGCPSLPVTSTVTVITPTVSISTTPVCNGQPSSPISTATGLPAGGSYLWSNTLTTPSVTYPFGSSLSVTYNVNGCSVTDLRKVINRIVDFSGTQFQVICPGNTYQLTGHATPGGTYSWNTLPIQTGSTIIVAPTIVTTYSYNYSIYGCNLSGPSLTLAPHACMLDAFS